MVELANGDLQLDNGIIIPPARPTMFVNKEFVLEATSHSCTVAIRTYLTGYAERSTTP